MKQLEQARVLLAKALEDESVAAALGRDMRSSDAMIGFPCQQAAEKLLKAHLSARSVAFRHTTTCGRFWGFWKNPATPLPTPGDRWRP